MTAWRHTLTMSVCALFTCVGWPTPVKAASPVRSLSSGRPIPVPNEPYNTHDYTLAFHVFLNDRRVLSACGVALAAVRARPDNLTWRRRLARTALWLGDQRLALRALTDLALHGDKRALKPAIALASSLSAFTPLERLLTLQLHQAPSRHLVIAMSGIYQLQGHPRRAIALLSQAQRVHPQRQYLWEIGVLYGTLGETRREMTALKQYAQRYGASARDLLAQASLLYLSGQTHAAYRLLYRHRHGISHHNFAYWHTLAGLAWLYQHFRAAGHASAMLYKEGMATRADLVHLVLLNQSRHPQTAFLIANTGLRRTHRTFFFFAMLGIAEQQGSRRLLSKTFAATTTPERKVLSKNPNYWTGYARFLASENEDGRADHVYHWALAHFPSDDALLASYLWFLDDTGHVQKLARTLPRMMRRVNRDVQLWDPYALGYLTLNEPRLARPYIQALLRRHPNRPSLLLSYADVVSQEGDRGLAITLENRAARLIALNPRLRAAQATLRMRVRLAQDLQGAPKNVALLRTLKASHLADRGLFLSYALSHSAYPLARLWLLSYPDHTRKPTWAHLVVALQLRNARSVAHLLATDRAILPRASRVTAAERLNDISLAQTLAFHTLRENREDWALVRQQRSLLVKRADHVGMRLQYMRGSGFADIMNRVSFMHYVAPDIALGARVNDDIQSLTDPTLLASIPPMDRSAQIMLAAGQGSRRPHYQASLGERDALTRFPYGEIRYAQQLSDTVRIQVTGRWHERAYDLPSLYVAATRTGLTINLDKAWTIRDTTTARLSYRRLNAQGGGALARGQIGALSYAHKLRLGFPDFTLGAGVEVARYQAGNAPPAQLLALVPTGQNPDSFFVPQSFIQSDVSFQFGARYLRGYSPDLRPFLDIDIFDNTVTHTGYDLTFGFALPVFGPDHLALYYTRGQGGVGISNRTQIIGARYSYLFKP